MGRRGMIATSQPLASAAGLEALRAGGNAVDAAVTAAAVLAVVEPTMTGVGGDLFALVFDAREATLRGLNSSGCTGRAANAEKLRADGHERMPMRGALSITVPGAVNGWSELLARHGTFTLARALQPAIECARDGFPVCEIVAGQWQAVEPVLAADRGAAQTFLPGGRAPRGRGLSQPGPGEDARRGCGGWRGCLLPRSGGARDRQPPGRVRRADRRAGHGRLRGRLG